MIATAQYFAVYGINERYLNVRIVWKRISNRDSPIRDCVEQTSWRRRESIN